MRPPSFWRFLRVLQKFDNFLELLLRFIGSGDILERRLFLLRRKQPRARLAEAQSLISAGLHLPHQEQAETNEQQQRRRIQQNQNPVATAYFFHFEWDVFVVGAPS